MVLAGAAAQAQEVMSGVEVFESLGVDFETATIRIETLAPGLHVMFGAGGNVAVSIGDQGVLIVDDQFPAMVPRLEAAIQELGGGNVDFVINTHWHWDHAEGNPVLGGSGSWIVAHANSRQMLTKHNFSNMVTAVIEQPPLPPEGLPVITYEDRMQFHFNGEQIDLLHFGPAHTTGDSAVVFRGRNVVHMGDLYFSQMYPFIDTSYGGDLDGMIQFCEAVISQIDEETFVIPGHGRVAKYADLVDYVSMLKTIRGRIVAMIEQGATLEEVIATKPTAEWDELRGNPIRLLDRAYASLTR
jgi:glyoxylase-like metal-dependent hydrolase (beta-lactamase superfamily II)